jgi:hypothetical protein
LESSLNLRINLLTKLLSKHNAFMNKINPEPTTLVLSGTVIVAFSVLILLVSFLMTSAPHAALATPSSVNATGGPAQKISQQGLVTSSTDPLPGHEAHQSAVILRLRADNALYDGTLTFTASKPVEVQILHRSPNSTTPTVPTEFGTLNVLPLPGNAGSVTISNIIPEYPEGAFVATLPFSGNAISLHNIEGEPFVASYSVAADIDSGVQRADDISAAETSTEQQAITEEEEEDETADEEEDNDDDGNSNGDNSDDNDNNNERNNSGDTNAQDTNAQDTNAQDTNTQE